MFYPNHQIRTYCKYLGSLTYNKHKLDLGVYETPSGYVSHAIVCGDKDHEYLSGDIDLIHNRYEPQSFQYQVNKALYVESLQE